jgi:PhoPQ-activated pathogenicity-related protein
MVRLAVAALAAAAASASPLWDFVHAPNPLYQWVDTGINITALGWTGHLLNLTSGSWLTANDSNRHIWTHQMLVVLPTQLNPEFNDAAALWITGGGSDNPGVPSAWDEDVLYCASLVSSTGTPCTVLYQIPNEYILFNADPLQKQRSEDAAVAFTWVEFMVRRGYEAVCSPLDIISTSRSLVLLDCADVLMLKGLSEWRLRASVACGIQNTALCSTSPSPTDSLSLSLTRR